MFYAVDVMFMKLKESKNEKYCDRLEVWEYNIIYDKKQG